MTHQYISLLSISDFVPAESPTKRFLTREYLNPSPATAKGHMKWPKKDIRSTRKKATTKGDNDDNDIPNVPAPVPQVVPPPLPLFVEPLPHNGLAYRARMDVNLIPDNELIANVYCFGAFTYKISSIIYNDLTGNFPSCPLKGVYVFLCCTIMKRMQSWSNPLQMLMTIVFLKNRKRYSRH